MTDPVIVGGGLAGLMAALELAPEPVLVLSAAPLGEQAASAWAQGGLAAAIGADDSTDLHFADTMAAGDKLCDPATARRIIDAGPALVAELAALGARFDRTPHGQIALGLEAGHSQRRIIHAAGDASGREILRAVIQAVRATPSITVWEGVAATSLILRDGAIAGVLAQPATGGSPRVLRSSRVIIATGGLGGLYEHSTNPAGALGAGLMLAARAGAALADLEFVQFHPTALNVPPPTDQQNHGTPHGTPQGTPMPLISEAVRGEGAILIDDTNHRFMANNPAWPRAELEPRDIVSRAVWARMAEGHQVFLDATHALGARFAAHFPGINAACLAAGINPATTPIPIRPAAHYHMGGIAVDADGKTTVPGLWACGEAAATGLHGANRLASNSLLEAAVTGQAAARSVAATTPRHTAPIAAVRNHAPADPAPVRAILSRHAGVLRTQDGLSQAIAQLAPLQAGSDPAALALMMTVAMRRRQESRGGHARTDFPRTDPAQATRLTLTLDEARSLAQENQAPVQARRSP